jgi:hypothetical protein
MIWLEAQNQPACDHEAFERQSYQQALAASFLQGLTHWHAVEIYTYVRQSLHLPDKSG